MNEETPFNLGDFAKDHWSIVVALGAFFVSFVGVTLNFTLFARNGFNYLDFADIEDFLVAGLKSPVAIIYCITTVASAVVLLPIIRKHFSFTSLSNRIMAFYAILTSVIFIILIPVGIAVLVDQDSNEGKSTLSIVLGSSGLSRIRYHITEGRDRKIVYLYGNVISEAGDFFLVKSAFGSVLLRKQTVISIDNLQPPER